MEASLSDLYKQFEERENSSDNSGDNSPSTTFISSPKRSRRAIQKKVVTFPIKDVEGTRLKGDCTPPSDSWAWRKYGQKPIKGSPYPRGYYRCSSSKGCPARKQVERSCSNPNNLVITYSYEHNHPWPTSRNHHQNRHSSTTTSTSTSSTAHSTNSTTTAIPIAPIIAPTTIITKVENNHIITNPSGAAHHVVEPSSLMSAAPDELSWFSDQHHHPISSYNSSSLGSCDFSDLEMAKIFPMEAGMGEEEDSLFAGLGELPECSLVFGPMTVGGEEQRRLFGMADAPWCGTTG